jgi:hypothetical protein
MDTEEKMEETLDEKAISAMIQFVLSHEADIANGLSDYGDLKPALKWIKEKQKEYGV